MKKLILGITFCFMFLGIKAQKYEFSIKNGGFCHAINSSDSLVFALTYKAYTPTDFQVLVFDKSQIISFARYQYPRRSYLSLSINDMIYFNANNIILFGNAIMSADNKYNTCLVILDACLKPKKFVVFNGPSDENLLYKVEKLNEEKVILTFNGLNNKNGYMTMIPFDIENQNLEVEKQVTMLTNFGTNTLIDDKIFYFGDAFRNNSGAQGLSLKAHMVKHDTLGKIDWEKLYVLDDNSKNYAGKDLIVLNEQKDFLLFVNDMKDNDNKISKIRMIKCDSSFHIILDTIISDITINEECISVKRIGENRILISGVYTDAKYNSCSKLTMIDTNGLVIKSEYFNCGNPNRPYYETFHSKLDNASLDNEGNILLSGSIYNSGTAPNTDAFIVKLNPDLTIIQKQIDSSIRYNKCGEKWQNKIYDVPEPKIITMDVKSFPISNGPVYNVNPGKYASIEKTKTGKVKAIIYPNPTYDILEFYSEDFWNVSTINFEIYNSIGQLVLEKSNLKIDNGNSL